MVVKAFPTAEGAGAKATGGRGGGVIFVDNLNDSGPGSLRAALQASGPRTIIFRVSGTIELKSSLSVDNPYYYIAGQTAPGQGIQIKNYGFRIGGHDGIIRFIRVRPGLDAGVRPTGADNNAMWVSGNAGDGTTNYNVIVDHCDAMWSTDQNMDVYGNVTDVTYQWCFCAEGLRIQNSQLTPGQEIGYGSLIGFEPFWGTTMRVSYHHNVWANCKGRQPACNGYIAKAAPGSVTYQLELRNNVMYNWAADGGCSQFLCAFYSNAEYLQWASALGWPNGAANATGQVNLIGNHWKRGPSNNPQDPFVAQVADFIKIHAANNLGPINNHVAPIDGLGIGITHVDVDQNSGTNTFAYYPNYNTAPHSRATPFPFPSAADAPVTPLPVQNLLSTILPLVGCSRVRRNGALTSIRDALSTRIANDVLNGTGTAGGTLTFALWNGGQNLAYPTLANGTYPTDSNNDGIPDGWSGLPAGALAQDVSPSGYSYLENYLNELAGDTLPSTLFDAMPPGAPTWLFVAQ